MSIAFLKIMGREYSGENGYIAVSGRCHEFGLQRNFQTARNFDHIDVVFTNAVTGHLTGKTEPCLRDDVLMPTGFYVRNFSVWKVQLVVVWFVHVNPL